MDNQQATAFDLGWLVGAIDGEGAIGITRRNRSNARMGFTLKPHVQLANTDRSFIERYCRILSDLGIPFHISFSQGKGRRRDSWQVTVAGLKRVIRLLPLIAEHLCDDKREKALLVQEFCESRLSNWHAAPFTKREIEIYEKVAGLNVKGTRALSLRDYTPSSRSSKFRFTRATEDIVQTTTA
jgi:hypothetical protein